MAERKRNRKKKELAESAFDDGKPTKEEYAVGKLLRQKLPEKKTMLLGHKVDYFIASKAIDCLLDSQWATKLGKQEALFTTRDSIVKFMDKMLQHKFFHRARKIIVQKEPKKKKKDEDTAADSSKEGKDKKDKKGSIKEKEPKDKKETSKEKELKDKKESSKEKETKDVKELSKISSKDKESSSKEKEGDKKDSKIKEEDEKGDEKKDTEKDEKKKEKKKIKLDMHLEQIFVDGNEAYVWIYDPVPARAWIIGMLMVVGAVLVCLFPLWPQSIRHYIYYLSVAAAFFLVFIIGLAIIRLVVFVIIWTITIGKHHLWLLPNLTEDVGFFESFWPLYKYEYKGTSKAEKDTKEEEEEEKEEEKEESEKKEKKKTSKETKDKESVEKSDSNSDQEKDDDQMHSESEHESEIEKDDKTENSDKTDNGFELIDPDEEERQQHHSKSD